VQRGQQVLGVGALEQGQGDLGGGPGVGGDEQHLITQVLDHGSAVAEAECLPQPAGLIHAQPCLGGDLMAGVLLPAGEQTLSDQLGRRQRAGIRRCGRRHRVVVLLVAGGPAQGAEERGEQAGAAEADGPRTGAVPRSTALVTSWA